ncbi:MAG TPA: hypothetical protein VI413_14680 [Paludibacter sp.]
MKRIITVSLFAFMVVSVVAKEQQNLSLNISKNSLTRIKVFEGKLIAYQIEFQLKNESNDPILFWNMNCNWSSQFIFTNESTYILFSCKSNAPQTYLILPQTIIKYAGILVSPTPLTQYEMKNLQVGFIYCDALKFTYEDYLNLRQEKLDISHSSYVRKPLIIWNIGIENYIRSPLPHDYIAWELL